MTEQTLIHSAVVELDQTILNMLAMVAALQRIRERLQPSVPAAAPPLSPRSDFPFAGGA